MKLLILKEGDRYFRIRGNDIEPCDMNKASVYPLDQYRLVSENLQLLHDQGYVLARIMHLTITESEYIG